MLKRSCVILLFVWVFTGVFSNAIAQTWTKKQLIHDLQFLNEAIKEGHPAYKIFGFNLDNQINSISNSGTEKYSSFNYEFEIRKCLRSLQCCHTYITESPLKSDFVDNKNPFFPFRMLAEGDDLYLTSAINDSIKFSSDPVKVLEINNTSSKDILDYFDNYQSADGLQTTFRNYIVKNSASIIVRRMFNETDSFRIVGIVGNDTTIINEKAYLTASAPSKNTVKDTIKVIFKNKESYFYCSEKLPQTGILKLKTFSSRGYSKFYKNIFKYQKKHQIKNILIDVRDNFGGSRGNVVELLSYFVKEEEYYSLEITKSKINKHLKKSYSLLRFIYFDIFNHHKLQKTDSTRKYIFKIEPNKSHFAGKSIVWTNGASLSSASTLTSYLQQKCNAIVVGEESGGGVYGNNGGSFPTLELPESKIKIQIPLYRLTHNFGNQLENHGIKPNFKIENTIDNMLKNNTNDLLFIQSILIN